MNAWWRIAQELFSPFPLVLVVVLVGLAIILVARLRRPGEGSPARHRGAAAQTAWLFEVGFDLLLDARWQEAADLLKAVVKTDPDRTSVYLELGKLFRRQGEPGRAARM